MKKMLFLLLIIAQQYGVAQNDTPIHQLYVEAVAADGLVRYNSIADETIAKAYEYVLEQDLSNSDKEQKAAALINAYNVIVIKQVHDRYPSIKSVKDESGFFTTGHKLAAKEYTLNEIEATILKLVPKVSIHMVLNCGAVSCPPLSDEVYTGENLDDALQRASRKALASSRMIGTDGKLSEIFRWYKDDFEPNVTSWIASRSSKKANLNSYQSYDWSLNDSTTKPSATGLRYYTSNLYGKGSYEINMFNNYYIQDDGVQRADWFTSSITALVGINKRVNVGLDLRIRATQAGSTAALSNFGALAFAGETAERDTEGNVLRYTNAGLSAVGLRVKYQPIKTIATLTFQHLVYIPTIGVSGDGFLDWESPYLFSDAYYDQNIGSSAAVFFNLGLHLENINSAALRSGDGFYQVSTPFTFIYSYFPDSKSTIYALGNFAPRWGYSVTQGGGNHDAIWSPYGQLGAGYKYFVTDAIQLEVLYTQFFDNVANQQARTFNIGVKYINW